MDPSYAQPASVTCRRCGEAFSVDLLLIVDAGERPDLLERVREGALHVFSCPRCGQMVEADAPLLLYFSRAPLRLSGREVRLLFSPARRTRPQEDEAQAGALLARLREALGPAWREEWLREGLLVLPRGLLPLFLREDPEAALRALTRTLEEFIGARTWEESRRILEAHPELLTDEADAMLGRLIDAAQAQGDEAAIRIFERHRALLRRCREAGIEEAFAELRRGSEFVQTLFAFIQAETWEESRRILEAHPELLTDEADAVLGQLIDTAQARGDEAALRIFERHRALLRRCREVGIPRAFAEKMLPPEVLAQAETIGLTPEQVLEIARMAAQMLSELREVLAELAASGVEIRSLEDLERLLSERPDLREKMEQAVAKRQQTPADPRAVRFEEILALQRRAENEPSLWPGVLQAWQELIRESEKRGDLHVSALAKGNLAIACIRLYELTGDEVWAQQAEQLLEALILYFRRETAPSHWATVQHALGNLFLRRYERSGEEAHARQAEAHYRNALEEYRRETAPSDWAMTQHSLGNLFARRYERSGEEAHARQAEAHYRNALEEYRRETAPSDWATVQHALGTLFLRRYERSGEEAHARQAEAHYRNALEEYRRETAPSHWATVQHALGTLFLRRYERSGEEAHARQAEAHYRNALEEYRRETAPSDWAMTQHSLGNLFLSRYERSGEEAHARQAEAHYRNALEEYRRETAPSDWAMTQHSLGNLFLSRYERSGEEAHARQAEAHYRNALEEYRRETAPSHWATVQHSLGNLFARRYERSGEEAHARQAEAHYRNALEVRRRETAPSHWATVQHSLGNLFARRYERSGEEAHARQAEAHYRAVLDLHQEHPLPTIFPFRAYQALASMQFTRGDWESCASCASQARDYLEELLSLQTLRVGKEAWLWEAQGLPARHAYALFRLGRRPEAVEALEAGRAQLLRESIERNRRDLQALQGTPYEPYYTAYIQATRHLDDLQAIPYHQRPPDWGKQINQALAAQQAAIEALRQNVPGFAYFLKPLPFSEIQRQAAEAPLVYMLATKYGGLALIVRAGSEPEVVELPELTEEALRDRLIAYFSAYGSWRTNHWNKAARQAWFAALDEACRWLWDVAMGQVVGALAGARSAVLIPSGLLGFLPFHAAWREDPAAPTGRRYALDDLLITYAPSAHALAAARQVASSTPANRLFAVDNPDCSLRFSAEEVAAALKHFSPGNRRLLGGEAATRQAVLEEIPRYSVLHFSTHGWANLEESLQSGLLMAKRESLTLGDIMDLRLKGARLAVLSACETGLPGAKLPEEAVSLPSGLIQAGVAGVVGSLWAVNEKSTANLMARFYDLWLEEKLEPPEALRQAQIWLRDSNSGYAHPFYWAAFSYVGA
jgi:hypothetical protein